MFKLRQGHLDEFEEGYRTTFEDRMLRDIAERFYLQFQELGEEKTRERIREGMERAGQYEIRTQRDVARFIRMMFGLRPDFDTARQTRFAGDILKQTDRPAAERLDEIKAAARQSKLRRRD